MKTTSPGRLFVGTSNIVLPVTKTHFPASFQSGSRLHYYASLFNSVELNSPFYKVPQASTFEKWAIDVPENFRFTVKLWKEITHAKNLQFDHSAIDHFLSAASKIGEKKGCLLVQFPGKITIEYYNQVSSLLEALLQSPHLNNWQISVEFRNTSWQTGETLELLDDLEVALVVQDGRKAPVDEPGKNASLVYMRFHGPSGDYRGDYTPAVLASKAGMAKEWLLQGRDVYAYFNNTVGNAFESARSFKQLVELT